MVIMVVFEHRGTGGMMRIMMIILVRMDAGHRRYIMIDYEYDYVIMFGWHSTQHLATFRSCEFARMRVPNKRERDAEVTLIVIELSLEEGRTENDIMIYLDIMGRMQDSNKKEQD